MAYKKRGAKYLYRPGSKKPFKLSRSRIDLFLECPRCFYLDRRLGLDRPSWPGWPLNSAVDQLLKNEFDLLRQNGEPHRIMREYGIDTVPFKHPELPEWRDDSHRFTGAKIFHHPTDLVIDGIIDDVWVDDADTLYIVDYKATSTKREISLEDKYKQRYKKQMEIYQWIFKQKGFSVSDTGYFVFANGIKDNRKFDGKLEFELSILAYKGDSSWLEPTLKRIKETLDADMPPGPHEECEYCGYRKLVYKETELH